MKMGLQTFHSNRLVITKSKPWICRKLCKSSVLVLFLSVILQWPELTTSSPNSNYSSQNLNETHPSTISSPLSLPLISNDQQNHDRTPRSIIDEKFRVFKYVTEEEAQIKKPINLEQDSPTESKTSATDPISVTKPVQRKKSNKNQNRDKGGGGAKIHKNAQQTHKVKFDPVLKSSKSPSVNDRSLIPNSFFVADAQAQNVGVGVNLNNVNNQKEMIQAVKNHHNNKSASSSSSHQHHHHHQNGNFYNKQKATDGSKSSSSSSGTVVMQTSNGINKSLAQNRNASLNRQNSSTMSDENILSFNATLELSEQRSRRSPYGMRNIRNNNGNFNGNGQMRIMHQNHMPIMHQNNRRISNKKSKNGVKNFVRKVQNGNNGNKRQKPRAALFNRNPQHNGIPGVLMAIPNGHINNNGQFKQQPQQGIRMQNNMHMNRGVAVVVPPQMQQSQKMDPILPSPSSNNFIQYQNQPNDFALEQLPTWNHPMYQRYAKAAKNVQNKVSGYISPRPNNNQGGRRDDNFRDFSKIPPIPLPRPRPGPGPGKNKPGPPRGIRSRPGPPPGPPFGPPGRYSYPKSAQSIQDILNHFKGGNNNGNNEIMNDVEGPGPKGSGSRYPTKGRKPQRYDNGMNDRDRDRENSHNRENGNRHHPDGRPGSIADLSSELTDVKFSLLRDIREFAKRPMNMGESDSSDSYPPSDRYRNKDPPPVIRLQSPPSEKPSHHHRRDDPDDPDDDLSWRTLKTKYSFPDADSDDPFSPSFNHEDGFDEIFNPKPKPVRELIKPPKQSSRYRQSQRDDTYKENDYDGESHYSRKKASSNERDFQDYSSDKEKDDSHSLSRYGAAASEDSTERSFNGGGGSMPSLLNRPSSPFSSSVEIEIERSGGGGGDRNRNRDRDRDRDRRIRDRDRNRDRDRQREGEIMGDNRTGGDRSYLSSFETDGRRRPNRAGGDRDREKGDGDYPKSIRDKLRDVHSPSSYSSNKYHVPSQSTSRPRHHHNSPPQYDYDSGNDYHKYPQPPITENKAIVLKRPFESYRDPHSPYHQSATTEKNQYGYTNPSNVNYNIATSLSPPPALISPHQLIHSDPGSATLNPIYFRDTGDILEIHTGQRYPQPPPQQQPPNAGHNIYNNPPTHDGNNNGDNNLHKAYLDLLQQKMHTEQALLNNQQQQQQHQHPMPLPLPLPPQPPITTTRKPPTPMRMKIHIYPNAAAAEQAEASPPQQNGNPQIQTQYHLNNPPNSGYYSGGGSSYSSNTVPLLSPRYPQKVGGTLGGYQQQQHQNLGPGPAPSVNHHHHVGRTGNNFNPQLQQHHPNTNNNVHNNKQQGPSGGSVDKNNKNLVLHLHVHRRNDAGPVELEAEASDHFMSTDKPINYKEIYEDHHNDDDANDNNNQQDHANSANNGETGDKSVSMEVPIHDDKIEDVLHTLLQLRDRKNPSRKRRRRK